MKEIKRTSKLLYKDVVKINGQKYVFHGIDEGCYIFIPENKELDELQLYWHEFEIIESPERTNKIPNFTRPLNVLEQLDNFYGEMKTIFEPLLMKDETIQQAAARIVKERDHWKRQYHEEVGKKEPNAQNPGCDKTSQVNLCRICNKEPRMTIDGRCWKCCMVLCNTITKEDKEKNLEEIMEPIFDAIKEKLPLTLRVGGVYRNRKGEIRTIISLDNDMDYYRYKDNEEQLHYLNGIAGLNPPYDADLIEEILPCAPNDHDFKVHHGNEGTGCFGKCKKCHRDANDVEEEQPHETLCLNKFTVSEKEKSEYCKCDQVYHSTVTNNKFICEVCKKEIKDIQNKSCYIVYVNGNSILLPNPMPLEGILFSINNKEIRIHQSSLKKQEGNPFKVGDEVYIYEVNKIRSDEQYLKGCCYKGKIYKINNEILFVNIQGRRFRQHYKQCELVEE